RASEVAGATWNEIDLDAAEWMLPAARTKNGREHRMPLTEPALAVLAEARTLAAGQWVFDAARGNGHVTIYGLLDAVQRILGPDAVVHDIRRTVATGLQRLGIRLEVTEAVLNHVSGSRAGVVGIYQRHDWAAEKRTALDGWARHVLRLAGGEAGASNIVALPAAGLHAA
ncbi:MAG: site-specific integrase, partial [Acetobacteraceae bacterium]